MGGNILLPVSTIGIAPSPMAGVLLLFGTSPRIVAVRDAKALAAAIGRLDDDRELANRLGQAAREKVLGHFDEQIVIRETIAVYDELSSATQANE